VLCCAVAHAVPYNSKDHTAFIFIVKEVKTFSVILVLKKEKKNRITSQKMRCSRRHKKTHIQYSPGVLTHKDKMRHSFL
jgi:hypothetical protein